MNRIASSCFITIVDAIIFSYFTTYKQTVPSSIYQLNNNNMFIERINHPLRGVIGVVDFLNNNNNNLYHFSVAVCVACTLYTLLEDPFSGLQIFDNDENNAN